jgi:hypothetical protein
MASNQDRLSLVTHYVIARCQPEKLGATKLNKVLWFSDVAYYRRHGRTITGAEVYVKRQHGPVPGNMVAVLEGLKSDGAIIERKAEPFAGYQRREFVWVKEPDLRSLDAEEVDILNEVMDWICDGESAKSISDKSHDALWDETEIGAAMPVRAAAVFPAEITAEAIEWARDAFEA